MAVSNINLLKLQWLFDDAHKVEFIETFMKIVDKQGKLVPFKLTDEQKEFVCGLTSNNIVSKSRQLGISSVIIALSIRECIVNRNATCVLISHSLESTNAVFTKLKNMFNTLPEWLKPEVIENNRQALSFKSGASIKCAMAGNKDLGRGSTLTGIVHLSEFAFWKNQEQQLQSILQAASESATIIIESTSNGINQFSNLAIQAKNKENSFKLFFFNWINGKTLFQKQYDKAVKNYVSIHGKMLTEDELEPEEQILLQKGATVPQLIWRREKISVNGLESFRVEYPSTMEESFMVTGSSIFDKERISRCILSLNDSKVQPLPKNKLNSIPAVLKSYLINKSLKIWKKPKANEKYYIGVDVSEGLRQDYSVCIVLDSDGAQVAEFRSNTIAPYQLADVIDALGRYYNKALLTVERASGGHSVIERLRYDKCYMNMTKFQTYDEFHRTIWKVGFSTNSKTKSLIINDFREWFTKGLIQINSITVLNEMQVFVASDNGSMGATGKFHDDCVMAMALAIQGLKNNIWYPF